MKKAEVEDGKPQRFVRSVQLMVSRAFFLLTLLHCSSASAAELLNDTLNGSTLGTQHGGVFVGGGGWQTTGGGDQLVYDLGRIIREGTCSLEITNFDPAAQVTAAKHQILNMYTGVGQQHQADAVGDSWWNVRVGTNYSDGAGMAGFKFLATSGGFNQRHEVRLIQNRQWNTSDTHTLTVAWTGNTIRFSLDGNQLTDFTLAGDVRVQKIYVGKDDSYVGYGGPIYKRVRVQVPDLVDAGVTDLGTPDTGATVDAGTPNYRLLSPVADSYVNEAEPNTNYGTAADIRIASNRTAFLRFDIPATGHVVNQAHLLLHAMNASAVSGGVIQRINNTTWSETAINWNNQPQTNGAVLDSVGPTAIDDLVELEVTPGISGPGLVSFAITTNAQDGVGYYSRESALDPPVLRLFYGGPAPDASVPDAETPDAGFVDSGSSEDVGGIDALVDLGFIDSGSIDSGAPNADATVHDDASVDERDANIVDSGMSGKVESGCGCQTGGDPLRRFWFFGRR